MQGNDAITLDGARALAQSANLPLSDARLEQVAALLNDWLPGANELSEKVSAAAYRTLVPITVFAHGASIESLE